MELIEYLRDYGTDLVLIVLLITGILVPKWVIDEFRKREAFHLIVIERLTASNERMADRLDRLEVKG